MAMASVDKPVSGHLIVSPFYFISRARSSELPASKGMVLANSSAIRASRSLRAAVSGASCCTPSFFRWLAVAQSHRRWCWRVNPRFIWHLLLRLNGTVSELMYGYPDCSTLRQSSSAADSGATFPPRVPFS